MNEDVKVDKSLVEQIYDELFKKLEDAEEFNTELINKLKNEAESGNLSKPKILTALLKS